MQASLSSVPDHPRVRCSTPHRLLAAAVVVAALLHGSAAGWATEPKSPVRVECGKKLSCLAYSPDGKRLAVGGEETLQLRDAATGEVIRAFPMAGSNVSAVALSPDGAQLLSCRRRAADKEESATIQAWDIATGKEVYAVTEHGMTPPPAPAGTEEGSPLETCPPPETITCVAFSRDGRRFATGSANGKAKVWDAARGKVLRTFVGHERPFRGVTGVAFCPDGASLATTGRDGTMRLWDMGTGRELARTPVATEHISSLAYSGDGKWAAAATSFEGTVGYMARLNAVGEGVAVHGAVHVRDVDTGKKVFTFVCESREAESVCFSHNAQRCAAGDGRMVRVWDLRTGKLTASFGEYQAEVYGVAFSPDDRRLAAIGCDGCLQIWDATDIN